MELRLGFFQKLVGGTFIPGESLFQTKEYKTNLDTRTIITRSLYIFYPIFHCSLYCRAVSVTDYLLVMSPSRAGSSHSSSWRIFSSARLVTFFPSARNRKSAENEPNFLFLFILFLIFVSVAKS